jgi:hypothetical protein
MRQSVSPVAAILVGGAAAAILDLASAILAFLPRGATPFLILQSIARGVYGDEAYALGWSSALLGLGFQFLIATTAAAVYYGASRGLRFMTERPILAGLLYGEIVYVFMNLIVMPLSAIGHLPRLSWPHLITGPIGHPFVVGLPIALAVRRFAPLPPRQ